MQQNRIGIIRVMDLLNDLYLLNIDQIHDKSLLG